MACVVVGCKSHSSRKENETTKISFHRLPEDSRLSQMWIDAISRTNWTWSKTRRICSQHFKDDCYIIDKVYKSRRLKPDAVPSVDLGSASPVETVRTQFYCEVPAITSSDPTLQQGNQTDDDLSTSTNNVEADTQDMESVSASIGLNPMPQHSSETLRHASYLQRRVNELEQSLKRSNRVSKQRLLKINCLKQKERRLQRKIDDLNLILEFLNAK